MVSCIYISPKAIFILFLLHQLKVKIYSVSCLPSHLGDKLQSEILPDHSTFDPNVMSE
jgi:hypothetical protein